MAEKQNQTENNNELKNSPYLNQYLDLLRKNEIGIIIGMFILIQFSVLIFTFDTYKNSSNRKHLKELRAEKKHDELLTYFQKKLKREPKNQTYLYQCAYNAYESGEYQLAIDYCKELEKLKTKKFTKIYAIQSKAYHRLKDMKNSYKYLNYALQVNAYNQEFRVMLAEILYANGKPEEAAEWLEIASVDKKYGEKAKESIRQIELNRLNELARVSEDSLVPVAFKDTMTADANTTNTLPSFELLKYLESTIVQ